MSFRSLLVCWMQLSNVSRSRHAAVRSACKIYWQGANVGARVDGFEKSASLAQSTRRPSPQPVNFFLEWLFTIQLLDLQKRTETTTELSEVKARWWLETHWLQEISCNQCLEKKKFFSPTKKKTMILNVILPKREICRDLKWRTNYINYYNVTITETLHFIVYYNSIFDKIVM